MATEEPDPPVPDALDLVVEAFDMGTVFAAHRLGRVAAMCEEALASASAHGRTLTDVVERGVRLELAAALRITEHAAGAMIALADAVVNRYPAVWESMLHAGMSERHGEILVAGLDELEPELRGELLPEAVRLAESEPVGAFRRSLRRLVDTARSETLAARHAAALARRRVVVEHADDGMAWLHVYAPAVEVHAIHHRVTQIAKVLIAHDDDERMLDHARADVVCDLLIDGRTDLHPAQAHGIRATVMVTVPALALLHDDDASRACDGHSPATVEGVGPIHLARARELVGSATGMIRVLTHPETGMVLSVGRDHYRPPPELRALAQWRSERCMAPGCAIPATRCDIDHNIPWEHGGETALDNLAPLCRGHHMVKHHSGWTLDAQPDGAIRWTSPAGRTYLVQPERPLPVFRPAHPADAHDAPF